MQVLDQAHFDHMTGADRSLQREVVGLFRAQVDGWTTAMHSENWHTAVHTLKGSARGIGLSTLAAACEHAEAAEGADVASCLDQVRTALAEALSALEQFVAAAA